LFFLLLLFCFKFIPFIIILVFIFFFIINTYS